MVIERGGWYVAGRVSNIAWRCARASHTFLRLTKHHHHSSPALKNEASNTAASRHTNKTYRSTTEHTTPPTWLATTARRICGTRLRGLPCALSPPPKPPRCSTSALDPRAAGGDAGDRGRRGGAHHCLGGYGRPAGRRLQPLQQSHQYRRRGAGRGRDARSVAVRALHEAQGQRWGAR